MRYLRHYYVTLCGKHFGKYVDICSTDKITAIDGVIKIYGILNVSRVYTEKAWQNKFTDIFKYAGYIESEEEKQSKRYGIKGW